MKNTKFVLFFLSLLSLVLFISCSKSDSNNPVNPGGGGNSGGGGSSNEAKVIFIGTLNSDTLQFFIVFKGKQNGTQNWDNDFGVLLTKKSSSGLSYYLGQSQGTTTISNYGAVGSKIEGSISGKMILQSPAATEVTISGNFSATRVADVN